MTTQMVLIEPGEVDWRLDEHTKTTGLRGIADARRALADAARRARLAA
ncbi:MAG: hypothetical protein ACRDY0_06465 [Acidimicrobiales bacterium]